MSRADGKVDTMPAGVPVNLFGVDSGGLPVLAAYPLVGTTTNNNAAAGVVGEFIEAETTNQTATVTMAVATPGVVTWTAHALTVGSRVYFTTTGALLTGLVASTDYYVVSVPTANTFTLSATPGGSPIAFSGTQSGTHTGLASTILSTGTGKDVLALNLAAGDYNLFASLAFVPGASTTISTLTGSISQTSATTEPGAGKGAKVALNLTFTTGVGQIIPCGQRRISLAAPGIVYLVGISTFLVSTMSAYGYLAARRVR